MDCSILVLIEQVRFNEKGFHSMPTYLNTMNNAILRAAVSKDNREAATYGEANIS